MDSMYAYIKGELAEKNIDSIVVEAAGVGYLIYIPTQYFDMLPDEGEDVKIYTYLCVREDAMILYGFLSKDDLEIFKLLITVSGIGPKGGLAILSDSADCNQQLKDFKIILAQKTVKYHGILPDT